MDDLNIDKLELEDIMGDYWYLLRMSESKMLKIEIKQYEEKFKKIKDKYKLYF